MALVGTFSLMHITQHNYSEFCFLIYAYSEHASEFNDCLRIRVHSPF